MNARVVEEARKLEPDQPYSSGTLKYEYDFVKGYVNRVMQLNSLMSPSMKPVVRKQYFALNNLSKKMNVYDAAMQPPALLAIYSYE